jgi:hypothetical protein
MEPSGSLHCLKGTPPVPVLWHLYQFHNLTSCFMKINFNITLPFTPRSPKLSLTVRYLNYYKTEGKWLVALNSVNNFVASDVGYC